MVVFHRDRHPDIYRHLEDLEVTPALYAAPWFITLFSSTFSVGFVARVYGELIHCNVKAALEGNGSHDLVHMVL